MEESKDRPFFLNLWQFGVHGPWGHKESYTAEFAKKTDPTGLQGNPVMASMLKSVDDSLGRVMDKLDELGIADRTIVIFYSDNGGNTHSMTEKDAKPGRSKSTNPTVASYRKWAGYQPPTNNAPLREGKGRIYEGGQRVPLMVRWPGQIEAGTTTDAVVGPIDLYPTIIDAIGIQPPQLTTSDGNPKRQPGTDKAISGNPKRERGADKAIPDNPKRERGSFKSRSPLTRRVTSDTRSNLESQAKRVAESHHHIVDGESFLPVLEGNGALKRDAYFTWFPHLIPAVSVRQGDWKLIRRFQPHRDYPEIRELYNLKTDIGETKNLATEMPDRVEELDALIDTFVKETGALYPQPNPAYKPRPASPAKTPRDPSLGLVPKFCRATVIDGVLRIEADGRTPFLGTAQVRIAGPLTLKLRIRSESGGTGRVQWRTPDQELFPKAGQVVDFKVTAVSQWQDITVEVPIKGKPAIVRLYLPAKESPVDIQLIEFSGTRSEVKTWRFEKTKKLESDRRNES
jgi:arylsulfatase A-like enzyme